MTEAGRQGWVSMGAVMLCAFLLSFITVFNQVKTLGLSWQEEHYHARLEAVAQGTAEAPAQYRVLSDILALAVCRAFERACVPRPAGSALVFLRLLQNIGLFLLAAAYYRRLGLSVYLAILGMMALAWGMTQSNYNSDLAINAYTDLLLYLGAGWAILAGRAAWIPALVFLGALNRETSVLIPLMALAPSLAPGVRNSLPAKNMRIALASFLIYLAVFAGLRAFYGLRPWSEMVPGLRPGWALFQYNVLDAAAWGHIAGTLGIMPLLALVTWRRWPAPLRAFFWAVVPVWCLTAPFCSALSETRVLLVPQALIFLPGALCGLLPGSAPVTSAMASEASS